MRITIDYNPADNALSVLVDRGTLSNGQMPYPPPPPNNLQFQELTSWLNGVFATSMQTFQDQKIAAIRFKYDPANNLQVGYKFTTESEPVPPPPPFIK
jgi:hypothetical protein